MLSGCNGPRLAAPREQSTVPPQATPGGVTASIQEASPIPSLGDIVWAASSDPDTNAPSETVTEYSPEAPRISAFLPVSTLPAGTTVAASWQYNDTSLDAFSRQMTLPSRVDRTWLSFYIERGDSGPWPAGVYEVTISLDGQPARRATVEVVARD